MTTLRGHNELSVDHKTWLNYLEDVQCIPSLVPRGGGLFQAFHFLSGGGKGGGGGAHFSDRKFVTVIFDKFSKYCNLAKFNFTINVTEIILWRTMTSTKK